MLHITISILFCFSILLCNCCDGEIIKYKNDDNVINYPTEYHIKGEMIQLLTGLVKPIEIWYSEKLSRYRYDYYGGTFREYFYHKPKRSYGNLYTVHSVATKELENKIVCEMTKIKDPMEHIFPDSDDLEFHGEIDYNGRQIQIWGSDEIVTGVEGYHTEETLWSYKTDNGTDIPIKYELKKSKAWKGQVSKHVIMNFYDFNTNVTLHDVTPQNSSNCKKQLALGINLEKDLEMLQPDFPSHVNIAYRSYLKHHKKQYTGNEHDLRKHIFSENWRKIVEHNSKNFSYKMEINKFSDRTEEELEHLTGTRPSRSKNVGTHRFPYTLEEVENIVEELPKELDLRLEGFIRPIKSQGNCGSCWAFSTTAAVEGAVAKSNGGIRVDLSEQSLVDCAWGYQNYGCDGGMLDSAFQYIVDKGIPTDADYGIYMEQDGYCNLLNISDTYKIAGFAQVTPKSPNSMKVALYKYGPVAVAIHANTNMKQYSNGIYYDPECKGESINHGVTIVGYGVRDGEDYWIVRNSWGADWGEDGYILMSAAGDNCLILDSPYYAIV